MAITKTNFINLIRCSRYASLDNLKKENLSSLITFEQYAEEETEGKINELLNSMFENDEDLVDVKNEYLEVMYPYYNNVELLAGSLASKYFSGTFKYAQDTKNQESFDCMINGIRYLCYVDIYNDKKDSFNIIEVKATTTKKFLDLVITENKEKKSIFQKGKDGIYYLLEDLNIENYMNIDKYNIQKEKLFNKLSSAGHYVYDLAVQRYIIENDLKQNNQEEKIQKVKYYLAVLNSDYIFNGKYENGEPLYEADENGNEIIAFIDFTSLTKEYMDRIDIDRKKVEDYVNKLNGDSCPVGDHCEKTKTTKCKYCDICFGFVPKTNSILNYFENHLGFVGQDGVKRSRYELLNDGYVDMLDLKESMLTKEKHLMQRRAYASKKAYFNKQKILDGIKQIKYPIYHLDFETFPCPLPRYKGEKCYTQSVFQFSLHIEREEGVCDKEKDHYEYLATDHQDRREELIKKMCSLIGTEGTILVYNESFEKTRLKELANIFPLHKKDLLRISNMIFDLMNVVKTKTKLYEQLGYSNEDAKKYNFYDYRMTGSYSIKKVLPLFSSLSYQDMEIGNGIEAMITYASFPKLLDLDYKHKYKKLVEYCKQDTWAMYCVLNGIKKTLNNVKS